MVRKNEHMFEKMNITPLDLQIPFMKSLSIISFINEGKRICFYEVYTLLGFIRLSISKSDCV